MYDLQMLTNTWSRNHLMQTYRLWAQAFCCMVMTNLQVQEYLCPETGTLFRRVVSKWTCVWSDKQWRLQDVFCQPPMCILYLHELTWLQALLCCQVVESIWRSWRQPFWKQRLYVRKGLGPCWNVKRPFWRSSLVKMLWRGWACWKFQACLVRFPIFDHSIWSCMFSANMVDTLIFL